MKPFRFTWGADLGDLVFLKFNFKVGDMSRGMWIRIHLLRIRIQLFYSMRIRIQLFFNTDPDMRLNKFVENYLTPQK